MCGIFGLVNELASVEIEYCDSLVKRAQRRGRDSSGFVIGCAGYDVYRSDSAISELYRELKGQLSAQAIFGHSRLITNGLLDNQPVVRDGFIVLHNGIITNLTELWSKTGSSPETELDSEVINALVATYMGDGLGFEEACKKLFSVVEGTLSAIILRPATGDGVALSNCSSLYVAQGAGQTVIASEQSWLQDLNLSDVMELSSQCFSFKIPVGEIRQATDQRRDRKNLIFDLNMRSAEEKLLVSDPHDLQRCTKCILPSTMPFIEFNANGECNYCSNYVLANQPKPLRELKALLEPYRRQGASRDCIVPFSGGRDSSYGLHLIVNELGMKPITYTYDWGMVTDLGRRNVSRMCGKLNVENIIVAADIEQKRNNIRKNLIAWLENPHLGMLNILMAGDKHFFRHVETVKKETGISLNLWGVNPLETTHFKAGFLGVPPYFDSKMVYTSGLRKQLSYQKLRLKHMMKSPKYFNSSIFDTLAGEYFRSFHKKSDYFHIFDYWRWDEQECDDILSKHYDWELAPDTTTTWRIGDGTAAFYNYVYHTFAGFSEHDTFRSNQIREGQISREVALRCVQEENAPRYANIKWYLDSVGLDFITVIKRVNETAEAYRNGFQNY